MISTWMFQRILAVDALGITVLGYFLGARLLKGRKKIQIAHVGTCL